jgi:hypothetical protein
MAESEKGFIIFGGPFRCWGVFALDIPNTAQTWPNLPILGNCSFQVKAGR